MDTTGVPFMQFKPSRRRMLNIETMMAFLTAVVFSCAGLLHAQADGIVSQPGHPKYRGLACEFAQR